MNLIFKEPPFYALYLKLLGQDGSGVGIPQTAFYDIKYLVLPSTTKTHPFTLSGDDGSYSIKISNLKAASRYETSILLEGADKIVFLPVTQGLNYVTVKGPDNKTIEFIINGKHMAGYVWSCAQTLYSRINSRVDKLKTDIYSKYATKLVEPLIPDLYSILPNIKSLQILSVRLISRVFTYTSTTTNGIKEMASALTLNTPYIEQYINNSPYLLPEVNDIHPYAETLSGKIVHLWISNKELIRWKVFKDYVFNISNLELQTVKSDEIYVKDLNTGKTEIHRFDMTNGLTVDDDTTDFDITLKPASKLMINVVEPCYHLDSFFFGQNLLGDPRPSFDIGIPFDMGIPFDADPYLYLHDGFLNFPRVGRLNYDTLYPNGLGFDSSTYVDDMIYTKGYYCTIYELVTDTMECDAQLTIELTL